MAAVSLLPIGTAAAALGTTPRVLRYRERLGLLPPERSSPAAHRRLSARAMQAAAAAAALEQGYGVGPAEVAFAVRATCDPQLGAAVRELAVLAGRLAPEPIAALDFEAAKGRRLLRTGEPLP